jgi:hypothetical protein
METTPPLDACEEHRQLLQEGIDAATRKRDYNRAEMLKECLRNVLGDIERLRKQEEEERFQFKIEQLQRERETEQSTRFDFVNSRLHSIHLRFRSVYDDIETRHRRTLATLQYKFSGHEYVSMHYSPDIRALERAEAFFAKNQEFKAAREVRIQIQRRSVAEAKEFQAATGSTIDAKVRDAVVHYQNEQKTLAQRLQNEKNLLKRDCDRRLLLIENKHRKILHKLTGMAEASFDLTKAFRENLHRHIDTDIRDFAEGLQRPDTVRDAESDQSEVRPPREPRNSWNVRISGRCASVRGQNEPRKPNPRVKAAMARAQNTVRIAEKVEAV